ncbi:unnamed protein product [Merluccius merluccius]
MVNIGADVSVTPEGLKVSWRNPNVKKGRHCYENAVRFKTTCDTSWEPCTDPEMEHKIETVAIEIVSSQRKDADTREEKLLEEGKETKGEEEQGKSWAVCSLTEADLQGYPTLPNGEYFVDNGKHYT